jgi:uncharacterized GH25 family protein
MKSLFILMLTVLSVQLVSAHALWLETSSKGAKNTKQEVKVYYGEYASKELEPIDKWYSDVKDFKLILTSPTNQKIELSKKANANHFVADFTPTEEGTYTLSISHPSKDLSKTNLYAFSSLAFVQVSGQFNPIISNKFYLNIYPMDYAIGNTVEATVIKDNKPLVEAEVIVMSEDGWSKVFKTDNDGKVKFPVLWKGHYVIEASFGEEKDGEWNGKPFTYVWEGTTTFITVK